jgi:hypothetical protein
LVLAPQWDKIGTELVAVPTIKPARRLHWFPTHILKVTLGTIFSVQLWYS